MSLLLSATARERLQLACAGHSQLFTMFAVVLGTCLSCAACRRIHTLPSSRAAQQADRTQAVNGILEIYAR